MGIKETDMDGLQNMEGTTPVWLKRTVQTIGVILIIIGAPLTINLLCIVPLVLLNASDTDSVIYGVISLTIVLLTLGAGSAAFVHANRALKNMPSKTLRFPSTVLMIGIFVFLIGLGLAITSIDLGTGFFFPPVLLVAALLPPLWAVAWMIPRARDTTKESSTEDKDSATQPSLPAPVARAQVSWRRGLLSFAGGATLSVLIAIMLEILLPVIIFSLVFNLADTASESLSIFFRALSNKEIADALTNPGFIFVFVQIAIIAPFAEELAKPLVTLPILRNIGKQEAFWVGALAGAGFAALENVIYAMSGFYIWAGILVVRSLGSALHPLGSGLVAQGWWDVLRGEKDAGRNWLKKFGIAVAVHAAWNGGSLLVITLGGARLFGDLPPEIDVLGFSAAGVTLAFLIILGISALWIGRAHGHNKPFLTMQEADSPDAAFMPSDRAIAIWAVACLIAIVPAGIAGLKLWLR